jgi:hypothetical protein
MMMKFKKIVLVLASLLAIPLLAHAQSGGGYELTQSAIGGGGVSSGGNYSLSGIGGQPDAGALNGGAYTLGGGFWRGVDGSRYVYLPIVLR